MSAAANILKADRWVKANGRPLSDPSRHYRLLYVGKNCLACYIFHNDETWDLEEYQATLRQAKDAQT